MTKPIILTVDDEPQVLSAIERDLRKRFGADYRIIKAADRYLRFVLMTGISKFSKVGVFSVLNNLDDLTMAPQFSMALGITEQELTDNFHEHFQELATLHSMEMEQLRQQARRWYDGFRFEAMGVC